jgi:hypothetical protein
MTVAALKWQIDISDIQIRFPISIHQPFSTAPDASATDLFRNDTLVPKIALFPDYAD